MSTFLEPHPMVPDFDMGLPSRTIKCRDLFGNFFDIAGFQSGKTYGEQHWQWPAEFGRGSLSMYRLRPGLVLGKGSYTLSQPFAFDFNLNLSSFVFTFSTTANIRHKIHLAVKKRQEEIWHIKNGAGIATYLPRWEGLSRPEPHIPLDAVGVFVSPKLMAQFLAAAPETMSFISQGMTNRFFYHQSHTTPAVRAAMGQILNCPFNGPLKRLFYEGKTLELLTHFLSNMVCRPPRPRQNRISPGDIQRIRRAGEQLVARLDNPPSLREIAADAGVNKNKLNQGFHQVFGRSVFDYLRTLRLEKARELLEIEKKSVTEVAFELGYAQHSSFTKAFKKQFGIPPSDCLRSARI